jgi:phi13 family phage major tail protein
MANKVQYGLSNVYYAIATLADNGTATYGEPVAWPGAVSLSLDRDDNVEEFYADNIVYFTSGETSGYSGTLETALIPDSFRQNVLGEVKDAKNVFFENADAETVHFALLFEFKGDTNAVKHVLYNCTATPPSVNSETITETVTPQTESLELTARTVYNATIGKNVIKARLSDSTSAAYANWNEAVYLGTAQG